MNQLAITVIGRDRPGIIADVTGALAQLGANLEDSSMTILRGHFAMTLVVSTEADPGEVDRALAAVTADGSLLVTVRAVHEEPAGGARGVPYVLSVHGADRPGIVSAVTRVLADAGGNVTDLTTRLTGELYVLVLEVDLPPSADPAALEERLRRTAKRLGVDVSWRPAEVDVL